MYLSGMRQYDFHFPVYSFGPYWLFMGHLISLPFLQAWAALRYKEIGVRKVTGAKRKTLIVQFLSESLVQAFISLVLALALTELLLPLFNQMMGKDITPAIQLVYWPILL